MVLAEVFCSVAMIDRLKGKSPNLLQRDLPFLGNHKSVVDVDILTPAKESYLRVVLRAPNELGVRGGALRRGLPSIALQYPN